jgi:hypothetical protein
VYFAYGRHVDDRIDILRRTVAGRRPIGDEQARRTSADEHELMEHGLE